MKQKIKNIPKECCRTSKRSLTLLEVLIAFAIIAICMAPLLAPHVRMLLEQKKFEEAISRDMMINNHFAELIAALYQGKIDWVDIENGKPFPLGEGSFHFRIRDFKPDPPEPETGYLVEVVYSFGKKSFIYEIFLIRKEAAE